MEWVCLIKVSNRLEAEMIKAALEAQEIPTHIFQEGAVRFGYAMAVGPLAEMEVCVPSNRITEAETWLEDYLNGEIEEISDESNDAS